MKFIFYAFYLLAAEVPIFLILYLRSLENESINNIIFILILFSISLNLFFCLYLLIKIFKKERPTLSEDVLNYNENNSSISDFFSFFLLPFFTFSFSSNARPEIFIMEIGILFLLLSTLLFKTNNLSANIIFYVLFKNYTISTTGKKKINILILSPLTIEDFLDKKPSDNIIKISRKYYIYYRKSKKRLLVYVFLSMLFLITLALFIIYLTPILNKLETFFT